MTRIREDCGEYPEGTFLGFTLVEDAVNPFNSAPKPIAPRTAAYQAKIDRALEEMRASLDAQGAARAEKTKET